MFQPRFLSPWLLLLALATSIVADGPHQTEALAESELLDRAESEFGKGKEAADNPAEARKHFARAAEHFAELRRRGVHNADLYRNLGNAHFLAGQPAPAILSYRRGLRLAPYDGSLWARLEYARSRVQYPASSRPPERAWPPWLPRPTGFIVLSLVFALYSLACAAWTRRLIFERGTGLTLALGTAAVLGAIGFAWIEWQSIQEERYPAVVVADDKVPFQRGNGASYPPHAELPALSLGMEGRLLHRRGDWLQIQLPGGEIGWVRKDVILVD